MATLPTSREVLTSIVNSIALIPASPEEYQGGTGNGLQTKLPMSSRPLLTTLHVLFPSILLPALDLLDRSLVTRISPAISTPNAQISGDNTAGPRGDNVSDQAPPSSQTRNDTTEKDSPQGRVVDDGRTEKSQARFYLVRSAGASASSKRTYNALAPPSSTPYIVRLGAWNCSCANFTFEAFQAQALASAPHDGDQLEILEAGSLDHGGDAAEKADREVGGGWSFGGMCNDGVDGLPLIAASAEMTGSVHRSEGRVPCCKHLLACLLAERWGDVLGRYVVEKRASKEEVAGFAVDI